VHENETVLPPLLHTARYKVVEAYRILGLPKLSLLQKPGSSSKAASRRAGKHAGGLIDLAASD
jgi:hypothetical protein